ncbi:hypothetical protein TNCV_4652241 [Trichonephila clavipes]|nr:hypothetical protein TNCV_4652241 [Trichonephila clavipes]
MTRKRVENRKGTLGYPGAVTPMFTKESKHLGKRKRSLGYLGIVTPVLPLRRQINLEVDSVFFQDFLDFHNQKLTVDELIDMHQQEQGIEELGL